MNKTMGVLRAVFWVMVAVVVFYLFLMADAACRHLEKDILQKAKSVSTADASEVWRP